MANPRHRTRSTKGKANYIYSIIGVSLVLFLLGILGWIVIYASKLSNALKENIEVQVIFNDATKEDKVLALKKIIDQQAFTKNSEYISKDQAAEIYKRDFGEDMIQILEYNPLYSSVNIHLHSDYVNTDSLVRIKRFLEQSNIVREVNYQKNLVDKMVSNVQKISIALLLVSLLLIFAVVFLIDNTIRLAMFSNRFLIKTMQMVGATRKFIARPFIKRSVINGVISGFMAVVAIFAVRSSVEKWIPELKSISNNTQLLILCIGIIVLGVLISYISTSRAVVKYLKTQLDDLY